MDEAEKLREAAYFLGRMREAQAERSEAVFRFELSAFLSAGRSVLQYACEEAKRAGQQQWYQQAVVSDPCIPFLKEERDANIHDRPVAPMTVDSVSSSAFGGPPETATEYFLLDWPGVEGAVSLAERYLAALERIVSDGLAKGVLTTDSPVRRPRSAG